MDVPGNVIANYTPFSAFAVNLCLLLLVFTSMGLLLLVCGHAVARKKSAAHEPVRLGRV